MADSPTSYADPYWTQLASQAEQRAGLPPGLLQAVVTHGERSNADQVSEAGAKTPFQITPQTRRLVLDRDGVDAYLNDQNAADAAASVLKDGMKWASSKSSDPGAQTRLAAGYYHAGGDTENWGPKTNAYVARVAKGHDAIQTDALANDVKAFKASNPDDPLIRDIGAWKVSQPTPGQTPFIPQTADGGSGIATPHPDAPMGPVDAVVGAGEAGLSAATGMLAGFPAAVASRLTLHSPAEAEAAGNAFTYQPRTPAGQQEAAALGDFANQNLTPLAGLAPELAALHAASGPALQMAAPAAAATLDRVATAVPQAARNIAAKVGLGGGEEAPPAGGMVGVGAAETADVAQRRATASNLDVPVDLTKGQATRDQQQLQFEGETAKREGPIGQVLRDNKDIQSAKLHANFDRMLDRTGAMAPDDRGVGIAVDSALQPAYQADRNAVRAAYRKAETSPEASAIVDPAQSVSIGEGENALTSSPIDYLNAKPAGLQTTGLLDHARQYALKLGLATKNEDGQLVAAPTTIKTMEDWRREISQATGYEPSDVRDSTILKGLIDAQTEPVAGPLYRQARAMRTRLAQNYEDHAVVSKLLDTKRGTTDRQVALEDVLHHSIFGGSLDDVRTLRRVLQRNGEEGGTGWQAWKELQGGTLRKMREQATTTAMDSSGRPVLSPARFEKAVRGLDQDGKLDFIFGKKGAQSVRDLNEVMKLVLTAPPGTLNHSNTAAVLMNAMGIRSMAAGGAAEAMLMQVLTGLPLPMLTALRVTVKAAKANAENRRLLARVNEALGRANTKQARQPRVTH